MSDHAEQFLGRVEEHVRYGTRYPQAVMEWLRAECDDASVTEAGTMGGALSYWVA